MKQSNNPAPRTRENPDLAVAEALFTALGTSELNALKTAFGHPQDQTTVAGFRFKRNGRSYAVFKGRLYLGGIEPLRAIIAEMIPGDIQRLPILDKPIPKNKEQSDQVATPAPTAPAPPEIENATPEVAIDPVAPKKRNMQLEALEAWRNFKPTGRILELLEEMGAAPLFTKKEGEP